RRRLRLDAGGPLIGQANDSWSLTAGNLVQLASGEKTNFGRELVSFARGNIPGGNIWCLRLDLVSETGGRAAALRPARPAHPPGGAEGLQAPGAVLAPLDRAGILLAARTGAARAAARSGDGDRRQLTGTRARWSTAGEVRVTDGGAEKAIPFRTRLKQIALRRLWRA